jgi:hypothetical protein
MAINLSQASDFTLELYSYQYSFPDSMKLTPWEANGRLHSQEILYILSHRFLKTSPLVHLLSHKNPVNLTFILFNIHFNISLILRLSIQSCLISSKEKSNKIKNVSKFFIILNLYEVVCIYM